MSGRLVGLNLLESYIVPLYPRKTIVNVTFGLLVKNTVGSVLGENY